MLLSLAWLVVHLSLVVCSAQPACEDSLPAGYSLGGAVFLNRHCGWRPQVHFVSSLSGKLAIQEGALRVPVVTRVSSDLPSSSSGPSRMAVSDVVLANFSLSDPAVGPVLWPVGLVQPGAQPGSTLPRRLYLQDVQMLVDSSALQQYLRFFRNASTLVYTDNATFLHVPFWADELTVVISIGLLLEVPGLQVAGYAGSKPAAGRNFVMAAEQSTLVKLLQDAGAAATSLPFLIYLSANVTLGLDAFAAGLPINRPMYIVGRSLVPTSIDFGMQVNQLVMLGTWSRVTLSRVVLENLAPGNARTLPLAGPNDVLMSYNVWPMLYSRSVNRMALHNCTLVLSSLEVEEYLYRATLFKVQPAGFQQHLATLDASVDQWVVAWVEEGHKVRTDIMQSTSMTVLDCNYTSMPQVAVRLPLPAHVNDTTLHVPGASLDHVLTHVDNTGVLDVGSGLAGALSSLEVMLLTTNMSFGTDLPKNPVTELQFLEHLKQHTEPRTELRHIVMGIVDPPVELDLGYSTDLVRLPADATAGYITVINVVALHLSQGPAASKPGANMMTPEIWTHLMWSIPRSPEGTSVWLSNVTLWVPAAEFSYIRSYTADSATNFTIPLTGGQTMQFFNVLDMRAEGVYIEHYLGPGMEAFSLLIKLEAGWSQDGPPKGFWSSGSVDQPHSGRLSDVVVVVLSVCLVTAVVASVLACLAFILWRKRTAEARAAAALAAAELSKAGIAGLGSAGGSGGLDGTGGGSGGHSSNHSGNRRSSSGVVRLNVALLEAPVHDSSDSYPLQDRALLTAELARSQFGVNRLGPRLSQGDGLGPHEQGPGGRNQLPPAAAAGGLSANSMASDACLQRLHSAITTMSQDVLSRRLQVSSGNLSLPGSDRPGGALGRPSPLGAVPSGDISGSPHAQQHAQLTPRHLQQLRQDAASGQLSGSHAISIASSQSLKSADTAAAAAAAAAAGGDQDEPLASSAGALVAAAGPGGASTAGSLASLSHPGKLGELKLLQLVGQGTFGQVYKALWRRRCVAVKVLQLPATAGSSDVAPWVGVGRVSSHREKMAVMETVVSTTMSHPNIVQVYTYVLQPLMSGQDQGLTSSNGKIPGNPIGSLEDKQQQLRPQLQLQQLQQEQQQQDQQQQQGNELQQQQEEEGQRLQVVQPQAAFLLAQRQHQEQQKQPPDVQQVLSDSPSASANGFCLPVSEQQQQQQGLDSPTAAANGSNGYNLLNGSRNASCNDSSQSLVSRSGQHHAMGKLTPEMAAAAAAALPAAAAAAAGIATGGGGLAADSVASSAGDGGSSGDGASGHPRPVLVGWELRLVMEFCDAGSLRTALDHKLLIDRTTGLPALECVLFLAHDVACAMIHLHSEHLLHGDLKASNVLLKRTAPRLPVSPEQAAAAAAAGGGGSSNSRRGHGHGQLMGLGLGLMAKVADFGLSLTLGPADTHVSQMHMGTLTHMAPELLLHGRASKASDVYAYGIMLWELATGRRPYSGTPVGMLAHKVVQQGWRPAWPGGCCQPVQALAESCWSQEAAERPCFEEVVQQLEDMAGQLDMLKQQQAQQMAAAAAPLCHTGTGNHELDLGHELTPSMMEELMPSGFSGGSGHSGDRHVADCGVVYEMSQLSCSQEREVVLQQLQQQLQEQSPATQQELRWQVQGLPAERLQGRGV